MDVKNLLQLIFLLDTHNGYMKKTDSKIKSSNSLDDEDWKRLEKWRVGRANFP